MLQTLFIIPRELGGVPLFGCGWLLGIWAVVSAATVVLQVRRHRFGPETRSSLLTIGLTGAAIALLVPAIMEPSGLPIRGYGVMLLLAVAAGVGLSVYRAERIGFDREVILSLAIWLFVTGIVGARAFYVIEYWDTFRRLTLRESIGDIVNVTQGGLVVYGGLLAAGAALVVFVHKYRLPGLVLSDLIAPGVILGMGVGRIGCFLNGCCFGGVSDLPWAVTFPAGSPPYREQAETGRLYLHDLLVAGPADGPPVIDRVEPGSPAARSGLRAGQRVSSLNGNPIDTAGSARRTLLRVFGAGIQISVGVEGKSEPYKFSVASMPSRSRPVQPTQLYSAVDAGLLCLFLLAYDPYRRREGELTALLLTIHPISRFLLEVIRIDESAVFGTGLSISQNISLGLLVGAGVFWFFLLKRPVGLWGRG